jgi:hypothetical protein
VRQHVRRGAAEREQEVEAEAGDRERCAVARDGLRARIDDEVGDPEAPAWVAGGAVHRGARHSVNPSSRRPGRRRD